MSKLTKIFSSVLAVAETEIAPELSPQTNGNWDSFNSIVLISELEKTYKIKISFDEAMNIKNFDDVKQLLILKKVNPEE